MNEYDGGEHTQAHTYTLESCELMLGKLIKTF
jgi:hypothetical protein